MDIYELAKKVGCPIANRNSIDSWDWDGETIAEYYVHRYDYGDAKPRKRTEHDLFHEVCHYLVANEEQRKCPEYGLAIGVSSKTVGPKGGPFKDENGFEKWDALDVFGNGFVKREESIAQEMACWILSIRLGPLFNFDPNSSSGDKIPSWKYFRSIKIWQINNNDHFEDSVKKRARELALQGIRELRKAMKGGLPCSFSKMFMILRIGLVVPLSIGMLPIHGISMARRLPLTILQINSLHQNFVLSME